MAKHVKRMLGAALVTLFALCAFALPALAVQGSGYSHIDTDKTTGISMAVADEDARRIDWSDKKFYASNVKDYESISNIISALARIEGGLTNYYTAYDVWYIDSDGYYFGGGLVPAGFFEYDAYVVIPMPSGWDAEATNAYRYTEDGAARAYALEASPFKDGKALLINVGMCSGRIVLTTNKVQETVKSGWQEENGTWYYYKDGKVLTNGWASYNGTWYYLGSNGKVMKEGWAQYNGKYVYIKNYKPVASGWVVYGGKYYYIKNYYPVVNGWVSYGGKWYHFGANGACDRVA